MSTSDLSVSTVEKDLNLVTIDDVPNQCQFTITGWDCDKPASHIIFYHDLGGPSKRTAVCKLHKLYMAYYVEVEKEVEIVRKNE